MFSDADSSFLIHEVTKEEVYLTILNLPTGCFSGPANNVFNGDLIALDVALHFTWERNTLIKHVFINSCTTISALNNAHSPISLRFDDVISNTKFLMNMNGNPSLHITPPNWLGPTISLTTISLNHHALNLFLSKQELPYWIMKNFTIVGFHFY
ncbi:uncharacterized protein LOC120272038 [Dioscorea cayenensis subsp. rotundata]|uniref:Uncharacterized protein LOC120272038 n=1 Tax=Dioscorea cayennensis subsp. rotundata TaxID=55577 RepID=A0AB40C6Z7_DIOCR|nr:uncharacterized protein LOC120272038 [Dioscorea cayenensis subsp. rotundata]